MIDQYVYVYPFTVFVFSSEYLHLRQLCFSANRLFSYLWLFIFLNLFPYEKKVNRMRFTFWQPLVASRIFPVHLTAFLDQCSASSGSKPTLIVKLAWLSRSTSSIFFPAAASAAPRLWVVVVFATPPSWFAIAMTFTVLHPSYISYFIYL